jgi:hypothetical protein
MYTLKLDWDDDRIGVVITALLTFIETSEDPEMHGALTEEQIRIVLAGAAGAKAALEDIRSYVGAREEAKRIARDCPGCSGEGEDHGG